MTADGPRRRVTYQPALDGIRGVSVALVLLFHGGFTWMTGGYVGVSVFFTLSGFLITGLLLAEHRESGRISMAGFYARRVRRLMPASLLCLTGICVAAAFGEFGGLPHIRRDVLAALLQVANWNSLHNGTSYAALVARGAGQIGPVDHFWSLSVEEQFYWVWPAVSVLVLASRRRPSPVTVLVGLALASIASAPIIAHVWGPNAAYWATPARLGEILVGAALAAVVTDRVRDWRWLAWVGVAGLAVVIVAAITWPADGGPAYHGWFGVFALASAALIAGVQPNSPLRSALSVRPLVHLGRISYGVYLYHWPIFAIVSAARLGIRGWGLFGVRFAITLAVAELSFHLVEQPVRRGAGPLRRVAWRTPIAVGVVAALIVVLVPVGAPEFTSAGVVPAGFAPSATTLGTLTTSTTSRTGTATTSPEVSPTHPPHPVSVLLIGDSTAVQLAAGMYQWSLQHPADVRVASLARVGCGFIRRATQPGDQGNKFLNDCSKALDQDLPKLLATQVPDVVVVLVTLPDVGPRTWTRREGALLPRDPRYAKRLLDAYRAEADFLVDAGVRRVLWTVPVRPSSRWMGYRTDPSSDEDWAVFDDAIDEQARRHPGVITTVRLDQWMAVNEPADGSMRADGLHLTLAGAMAVSADLYGPLMVGPT